MNHISKVWDSEVGFQVNALCAHSPSVWSCIIGCCLPRLPSLHFFLHSIFIPLSPLHLPLSQFIYMSSHWTIALPSALVPISVVKKTLHVHTHSISVFCVWRELQTCLSPKQAHLNFFLAWWDFFFSAHSVPAWWNFSLPLSLLLTVWLFLACW